MGASTVDFSWAPRKLFRQMLYIMCWCSDMKPLDKSKTSWQLGWSLCLSSNAQSKVAAMVSMVREEDLCADFLQEKGTFSKGWVWGFLCLLLGIHRNKNAQQNCGCGNFNQKRLSCSYRSLDCFPLPSLLVESLIWNMQRVGFNIPSICWICEASLQPAESAVVTAPAKPARPQRPSLRGCSIVLHTQRGAFGHVCPMRRRVMWGRWDKQSDRQS